MNAEEFLNNQNGILRHKHTFSRYDTMKLMKQYAQQVRREMWDDLATGGLVCGTEEMRKGCIQCQTEYKKHCGDSNHQNQEDE